MILPVISVLCTSYTYDLIFKTEIYGHNISNIMATPPPNGNPVHSTNPVRVDINISNIMASPPLDGNPVDPSPHVESVTDPSPHAESVTDDVLLDSTDPIPPPPPAPSPHAESVPDPPPAPSAHTESVPDTDEERKRKNREAVQKCRANKKKMIEEYQNSGNPELMDKARQIIEGQKAYNRKKGQKRRKTLTIVKNENKGYQRKTLDLGQAIKPSAAAVRVPSQRVTRSTSNVLSKENRGKSKVHYGNDFVNSKVNEFIGDCLKEYPPTTEGVYPLMKKLEDSFKWYPPNVEIGSGSVPKPEKKPPQTATMWYNCNGTEWHKWLTVKPSLIPNAGYGLFAERKFQVGDILSVYLGSTKSEMIDGKYHKKIDPSDYKLEITLPESNIDMQLDIVGGGFPDNKVMYLGAHMFNDPMFCIHDDDRDELQYNVKIAHDLTIVAEKEIDIGDEIYGNYNYPDKGK